MDVVVTGGSGFLGAQLARVLLAEPAFELAGGPAEPISALTMIDQAPAPPDLIADPRVHTLIGDLNDLLAGPDALAGADLVFHLAAAVSGECELDFDLGMRSNLAATESLLHACRVAGRRPVVVFVSSLAVYGGTPDQPLPPIVTDDTLPTPRTSYGTQKYMCEQLVADYSRRGFIRGRSVRPVTVAVRPGRPNGAASGFFSAIIREPLAGQRVRCPVPPDTEVALSSPARTIEGIVRAATASDREWGPSTAVNLPSVTVTVADMVAALERAAGRAATELIDWDPDPAIEAIVASWPARFRYDRAIRLGLHADADIDSIVRDYRDFVARDDQGARIG